MKLVVHWEDQLLNVGFQYHRSVRMMTRQLVQNEISIDEPELCREMVEIVEQTDRAVRQPYIVTEGLTIHFRDAMTADILEGVLVDMVDMVDG